MHDGMNTVGQPKTPEDQQLIAELHQRGKHAQEQADFHAQQLRMYQRVTEACERALNSLEDQLETADYDQAEAPSPSRFR